MNERAYGNSDDLLMRLGRVTAEEAEHPLWPELERLTRGELDAARVAELEQQSLGDPALRQAFEAHQPLAETEQERISQSILGAIGRVGDPLRKAAAVGLEPLDSVPQRNVTRASASRYRALWFATPLLAAAAAIALWLQTPSLEALTPYRIEIRGAAAQTRSPEGVATSAQPIAVTPGQSLEVLLRPAVAHSARVEGRVFVESEGRRSVLDASIERSASGSLRLALHVPGSIARGQLVVLVASSVKAAELARAEQDSGPGWQQFRIPFESKPLLGTPPR